MRKPLPMLLLAASLAACGGESAPQAPTDASQPSKEKAMSNPLCSTDKPMPGGWHDAEVGDEAAAALGHVLQRMNSAAQLEEILAVKTQVVAGLNFAIDFRLDNGEVWNTRVYRDLQGNFEMTQSARRGSMTDGCE